MTKPNHEMYDKLLGAMEGESAVSRNVLARVLVRVMISAPGEVARADIARGVMLAKPSELNQSAVSKAVACLVRHELVTENKARPDEDRAGRPIKPLQLGGAAWALMGIKIVHRDDKPVKLYGVVIDMRVDQDLTFLATAEKRLSKSVTFRTVAKDIKALHDSLLAQVTPSRALLGVGIEVASHVDDGVVVGATHVGLSAGESFDLLTPLQDLLHVPVVIDNDVNVLAVRQTYRPQAERHVAVVAVLEDGVGGSLIIDGHVYRGGGGMAAEPGHHTVVDLLMPESATDASSQMRRFADPCHCGRDAHVDCYAVPSRLEAELGASLADAGAQPARSESGELSRAARVFRAGGAALGQGIASILNTVNPSRLVLYLPGNLAPIDRVTFPASGGRPGRVRSGTAAAEYLAGVEAAIDQYSFSRAAHDARAGRDGLTLQILDLDQVEEQGALCAAIRVLDAFVMHARERDRCRELVADGSRPLV